MKTNNIKQITLLAFGLIFIASACSSAVEETTVPETVPIDSNPIVSATGKVVPEQEALLSVSASGVVEDVLVDKGDTVSNGQVLVLLEGTEQQIASVSAAELELANAKFAFDTLPGGLGQIM